MGALRAIGAALAAFALALAPAADARETEKWRPLAAAAAARFGLPEAWVLAVIEAESAGRTEIGGRPTTSHAGAMGLMQIMPGTWADLRAAYGLGSDPHDPADNIVAGTAYLRRMYDLFGYPGLFGAYNAGPGRYGEHVSRGRPLPRETRNYMTKILGGGSASRGGSGTSANAPSSPGPRLAEAPPVLFARSPGGVEMGSANGAIAAPIGPPDAGSPHASDPIFLLRRDGPAARD